MSSNIRIKRICNYCNSEFTAKTTTTKYCSHKCSQRAYKDRKRNEKINRSNETTSDNIKQTINELKALEFLTVSQASKLIGCSRQNVYKLIKSGKLEATNILERKTIIKRTAIDKLFEKPKIEATIKEPIKMKFELTECYTISEVQDKYKLSEKTVYELIKRNDLPKLKIGWYSYVPKQLIDELLN